MTRRNSYLPLYVLVDQQADGQWLVAVEAGAHVIPVSLHTDETDAALARDLLDAAMDVRVPE